MEGTAAQAWRSIVRIAPRTANQKNKLKTKEPRRIARALFVSLSKEMLRWSNLQAQYSNQFLLQPLDLELSCVFFPCPVIQRLFQELKIRAQFHLAQGEAAKREQGIFLLRIQFTRLAVNHAQSAERKPIFVDQWRAGVEADVRFPEHQGTFAEARILQRIWNDEKVALLNGVSADRTLARCLVDLHPHSGFEPLPVVVHQGKHGHGRSADVRRKDDQIIKRLFRFTVKNGIAIQRSDSSGFHRSNRSSHEHLPRDEDWCGRFEAGIIPQSNVPEQKYIVETGAVLGITGRGMASCREQSTGTLFPKVVTRMISSKMTSPVFFLLILLLASSATRAQKNASGPADRELQRRSLAMNLVRTINTAEMNYKKTHGAYATWDTLLGNGDFTDTGTKWAPESLPTVAHATYNRAPEIVPGWKLRLNLSKDGMAYDLLLEDVTDPKCGYAIVSDDRGMIRQSKVIDCPL
jgi:hypothetical protein